MDQAHVHISRADSYGAPGQRGSFRAVYGASGQRRSPPGYAPEVSLDTELKTSIITHMYMLGHFIRPYAPDAISGY